MAREANRSSSSSSASPTRRGRGRPRLPPEEKRTCQVRIHLEGEDLDQVRAAAAHAGMATAIYCRRRALRGQLTVPAVAESALVALDEAGRALNGHLAGLHGRRHAAPQALELQVADLAALEGALGRLSDALDAASRQHAAAAEQLDASWEAS